MHAFVCAHYYLECESREKKNCLYGPKKRRENGWLSIKTARLSNRNPHKHTRTTLSICCFVLCSIIFHYPQWISKPIEHVKTDTHTHRPKTVWRGEMNQKEFGWIRFMEASYPVVRFATYPIDGSVYLVDHRLENSVPELLLISMPLRRKKNSIVAKRTLSIQIPDGTTGQKGF